MKINRESGLCNGRGFLESGSFLNYFFRWILAPVVPPPVPAQGGGAGWHLISDRREEEEDPYVVVSNHDWNQAGDDGIGDDPNRHDEPHKILKITQLTSESVVRIAAYAFWDRDSRTGYAPLVYVDLATSDDNEFNYDFRGGPTFMSIGAKDVTVDPQRWGFFVMSDFEGDSRYLEGPDVAAPITGEITAGSTNKVLQFDVAGTASNFTVGKYYYLYDFNRNIVVDYQKCVATNTDDNTVTIEFARKNFPAGSVLTAYTHRWIFGLERFPSYSGYFKFPYCSATNSPPGNIYYIFPGYWNNVTSGYTNRVQSSMALNPKIMARNNPNDRGDFFVGNPFVYEYRDGYGNQTDYMNRVYGILNTCQISLTEGLSQMSVGRTIDGKNYMYAFDFSQWKTTGGNAALLIPDYDSLT